MWFRTGLIISAAALLSVALWMATHVSETPNILGRWSSGYAMALFGLLFVSVVLGLLGGPFYRYVHSWRYNVALLAITSVLSLAGLARAPLKQALIMVMAPPFVEVGVVGPDIQRHHLGREHLHLEIALRFAPALHQPIRHSLFLDTSSH